ncbi:MAG: class I SAM-dependent methyltransferase [Rhodospirillales bacterium]|nr:class I SAM-dependent methyltransferase [Rhodospirillales bacterium]
MKLLSVFAVSAALLFLAPPAVAQISGDDAKALATVIAGDHREAKNSARDIYRHPLETLSFLGLRPDMTVVEIYPGGGWYTEILAPYLNKKGRYYAASWVRDSKNPRIQKALQRYHAKLVARPDLYGATIVTELSRDKTNMAPAGSADMVLTFRNVHNWMKRGYDAIIFGAMYKALKPGGVLGLVEHRGDAEDFQDPQALSGYVNQDHAIELAEAAGFKFVGSSEINANAKDSRKHPKGVWTLPPSLRLKDKDREKYLAIGESDRMTLKFIKPE